MKIMEEENRLSQPKDKTAEEACLVLTKEAHDLYLPEAIPEETYSLTPFEFYREYVSKNIPVLIKGGCAHWGAIGKWNADYFRQTIGDKELRVAVTPNGYADAVDAQRRGNERKEFFVMPDERTMTMSKFLDTLETFEENVYYVQRQNSNFTEDFPELQDDIESEIPWASKAFARIPDAVNFWMGDLRAVTSLHKDPYENIYCVVHGEKEFILHPPTDLPWIPYKKYPQAVYKEKQDGEWEIVPLDNTEPVPWIGVNPLIPDYDKYPMYSRARALHVTVSEGDALYLPSLWFHHVTQSNGCIAINYWYDMEYDIKYAYYKAIEALCK